MAPKGRKSPPPAALSSSSDNDSDDNSSSSEERQVEVQNDAKPAAKLNTESDSDSGSDSPPPLKPGKRPASESDKTPEKKKKAKTDKAESSVGLTQDESGSNKKVLFQRLWSEEDELVILKGMVDYKVKKLRDAISFPDDFLQFIKKSLQFVDANKSQIVRKIQSLKKKYKNAKKKKITNPNELKAFQLSKQVWGGGDDDEVRVEENNGAVESHKGSASNPKSKANNNKEGINGQALEGGMANRVISSCEREMPISVIGDGNRLIRFFNERVLKEGMKLLGEGERAEMADKLQKHNAAEMEVYLKRMDLIKKTLNAVESARK